MERWYVVNGGPCRGNKWIRTKGAVMSITAYSVAVRWQGLELGAVERVRAKNEGRAASSLSGSDPNSYPNATSPQGASAPAAMDLTATRRAARWQERSMINWLKSCCGSGCVFGYHHRLVAAQDKGQGMDCSRHSKHMLLHTKRIMLNSDNLIERIHGD
eukprot:scaffold55207_cov62-Attheya_sp.AAC.2